MNHDESVFSRAGQETKMAAQSWRWRAVGVIASVTAEAIALTSAADDLSTLELAGLAALLVLSGPAVTISAAFAWALVRTPVIQRDEARSMLEATHAGGTVELTASPGKRLIAANDAQLWIDFEVRNTSAAADLKDVQVTIADVAQGFLLDERTGRRREGSSGLADWSPVLARWGDETDPGGPSTVTIPKGGGTRRFRLAYGRQAANQANLSYFGETRAPPNYNVRLLSDGPNRVDLVIDSPQLASPISCSFMVQFTKAPATLENGSLRLPPPGTERFEAEPWESWWAEKQAAAQATAARVIDDIGLAMEEGRALLKRSSGSRRGDPDFEQDYARWVERGTYWIKSNVGYARSVEFANATSGRAPAGKRYLDYLRQAEEIVAKLDVYKSTLRQLEQDASR